MEVVAARRGLINAAVSSSQILHWEDVSVGELCVWSIRWQEDIVAFAAPSIRNFISTRRRRRIRSSAFVRFWLAFCAMLCACRCDVRARGWARFSGSGREVAEAVFPGDS